MKAFALLAHSAIHLCLLWPGRVAHLQPIEPSAACRPKDWPKPVCTAGSSLADESGALGKGPSKPAWSPSPTGRWARVSPGVDRGIPENLHINVLVEMSPSLPNLRLPLFHLDRCQGRPRTTRSELKSNWLLVSLDPARQPAPAQCLRRPATGTLLVGDAAHHRVVWHEDKPQRGNTH